MTKHKDSDNAPELMVRIAVDAMGGDHAPQEIVEGVIKAVQEDGVQILLVGREEIVLPILEKIAHKEKLAHKDSKVILIPASQVVEYDDNPAKTLRTKPDSSIAVGMKLLKKGEASAFISAGHSGAVVFTALMTLGRLPGVERPALSVLYPTARGTVLFLDVGANADCRPTFLVQFAHLGSRYIQKVKGVEQPRIGLLNMGEEEGKGNRLVRESYALLKKSGLNFIGNVEGKDISHGVADVIVTDGFTGNVVLKTSEGFGEALYQSFISALARRKRLKMVRNLVAPALKALAQKVDYREYGGAPLLGVRGNVFVAHGRSQAKAITSAIRFARIAVEKKVIEALEEGKDDQT